VFYFLKISTFFLLFFILNFKANAEDFWRLRYLFPYLEEYEITRNTNKHKVKPKASGHSVNLILTNGIGIGYNSSMSEVGKDGSRYKFKNHFLDLSYTIGNTFSFTIGAGSKIYGRSELSFSGRDFVTERSKGEAYFVDFGIPFLLGELIFGYRQNYIEYKNFQTQIANESLVLEDSVKLSSSQFNTGIGILF